MHIAYPIKAPLLAGAFAVGAIEPLQNSDTKAVLEIDPWSSVTRERLIKDLGIEYIHDQEDFPSLGVLKNNGFLTYYKNSGDDEFNLMTIETARQWLLDSYDEILAFYSNDFFRNHLNFNNSQIKTLNALAEAGNNEQASNYILSIVTREQIADAEISLDGFNSICSYDGTYSELCYGNIHLIYFQTS